MAVCKFNFSDFYLMATFLCANINVNVMERYLSVETVNGVLLIPVSECLYKDIVNYLEDSAHPEVASLSDFCQGGTNEGLSEQLKLWVAREQMNSIFVKDRDYFKRIDFDTIRWIEASGSYCRLYLRDGSKMLLSFNLRELAVHLPVRLFIRVHRSYIVNIAYIDSFIGNRLCIGDHRIPVSKQHKRNVIARLNVLGSVKD